jgi:hypothetical protein
VGETARRRQGEWAIRQRFAPHCRRFGASPFRLVAVSPILPLAAKPVAVVMFPTRAGLKDRLSSIVIGTQTQSADGKTFVNELAHNLQKKFGDPSRKPQTVRSVKDNGR